MDIGAELSRRERQIMDVVYARGTATAKQVLEGLPDPPSNSAVRTHLSILEEKGHLKHSKKGREYVYRPTRPRGKAGRSAVRRVVDVFFGGSLSDAVAAHLVDPETKLTDEELSALEALVRRAREKEE